MSTIVAHLKGKLDSSGLEWRRVQKSLAAIEYLLKNGSPRLTQDFRYDMFKISTLQNFSFYEEGTDKGAGIRDKATLIVNLLQNERQLEEERVQAAQYREKFYGSSRGGAQLSMGSNNQDSWGGGGGGANQSYGGYQNK